MFGAEFWVAVSFVLFVGMLMYFGVPAMIGASLDKRADEIRKDIEQARRLKEDAQSLLADYQRRQKEAMKEADEIVAHAKREAEAIAAESRKSLEEQLERRAQLAKDKIARAEAQAVTEVRARSVDVAVSAAEKIIGKKLSGSAANDMVSRSLDELKGKLG